MFPPPHNKQKYIWGRIDTIYNPICYDNMFNNAFKSLLRFLKENGFPYKCRLYGNSQRIAIQWFCLTECSNILWEKNQLCYFRGKHRWLSRRYAGLGYSLFPYHKELLLKERIRSLWVFSVYQSTCLAVSGTQKVNHQVGPAIYISTWDFIYTHTLRLWAFLAWHCNNYQNLYIFLFFNNIISS